jgi:hypothetical protein
MRCLQANFSNRWLRERRSVLHPSRRIRSSLYLRQSVVAANGCRSARLLFAETPTWPLRCCQLNERDLHAACRSLWSSS